MFKSRRRLLEPGYQEDLAFIHDAGFTELAHAASRELLDRMEPPGRILDLGCGGGALSATMTDAGFDVWGLDLSPDMVAMARKRVPGAQFMVGDVHTVDLPSAVAIAAVGEVLNYAFSRPDSLVATLQRIRAALQPGGIFLFDVAAPGRAPDGSTHRQTGPGWRVEASAMERDGWLTRTIDTWRTVNGTQRHAQERHRLRLLAASDVVPMLEAAGFAASPLGGYDDMMFQQGWDGYLATAV